MEPDDGVEVAVRVGVSMRLGVSSALVGLIGDPSPASQSTRLFFSMADLFCAASSISFSAIYSSSYPLSSSIPAISLSSTTYCYSSPLLSYFMFPTLHLSLHPLPSHLLSPLPLTQNTPLLSLPLPLLIHRALPHHPLQSPLWTCTSYPACPPEPCSPLL